MNMQIGDLVRLKTQNPLDCVVGIVERLGARQAKVRWIRLPWTSSEALLPEMSAFPLEQLALCRDPWSDARLGRWSDLEQLRLRIRAAELWLVNANGQLGNARTDLLPHQVCLVHEVVEQKVRRFIIAEEVGMGKTIETGMIVHALKQRRELERCLVICPAGQIRQWQEELEEKLRVRFEIYRHDIGGTRAFGFPMVIASLDTVKLDKPSTQLSGKSHREILLDAPNWDLIVFDEAHRLTAKDYGSKTEKTLNYRLAEELCERTRDFLFLTGTPHDGNDSKFRNLLKALDPTVVFSAHEKGRFFGNMVLKNRKSEATSAEGTRLFKNVAVEKVACQACEDGEKQFHETLNRYLIEGYGVADADPNNLRNRAIGFVMTTFQKLATSSVAAVRKALEKRLELLEGKEEKTARKPDHGTEGEDDRFAGEAEETELERLQVEKLRHAFAEVELKMLRKLVNHEVPSESKWIELRRLISEISKASSSEKFLIFTEYRGTVAFLVEHLENEYGSGSTATIMGGMSASNRHEAMDRFKHDSTCRFLISTEAGGEGINLQFCHLVVNYDLPWNPFRLVQRTGRVHRIGQTKNMRVFNLQLRNDLDERLADCHESRVDSAVERLWNVTGWNSEDIRDQLLGFAQEYINYEQIYREALSENSATESEIEISEGIKRAENAFRLAYDTVFQHAVSPFNPERFDKIVGSNLKLDDLREWLAAYLKLHGRRLMYRETEDLWEFLVPDALKDRLPADLRTVKGTFDRKRAMRDSNIELLAFGHPVIEMLGRHALAPNATGSLSRSSDSSGIMGSGVAWLLVQEGDDKTGASFQMLAISWDNDARYSILPIQDWTINALSSDQLLEPVDERGRDEILTFLASRFPNADFIEEKIFWVGLIQIRPK